MWRDAWARRQSRNQVTKLMIHLGCMTELNWTIIMLYILRWCFSTRNVFLSTPHQKYCTAKKLRLSLHEKCCNINIFCWKCKKNLDWILESTCTDMKIICKNNEIELYLAPDYHCIWLIETAPSSFHHMIKCFRFMYYCKHTLAFWSKILGPKIKIPPEYRFPVFISAMLLKAPMFMIFWYEPNFAEKFLWQCSFSNFCWNNTTAG